MKRATINARRKRKQNQVQRRAVVETIQRQFGVIKDGKAVIATETPVMVYDEVRRQWVRQVLLMDGVRFRQDRNQLPIVDTHNDKTVRNVFGSIREITIEGDKLVGVPSFASDEESQTIATRYTEGHLNDFSIDAQILQRKYIPEGQSFTTSRGNVIEGPAEIITAWEPHNASICATGADPNSTVRRSADDREGVASMDDALMAAVSKLGVPEGMTDPVQIISFLAGKVSADEEVAPAVAEVEMAMDEEKKPEEAERMESEATEGDTAERVAEEVERQLKAEKLRRQTIINDVKLAKIERSFADKLIDENVSIADARERIIRHMATQPLGSGALEGSDIRTGQAEHDKFLTAATAGLVQRCFQGNVKRQAEQAEGAEYFRNLGIYRLAEHCVRRMGLNPERYNKQDVARLAMGHEPTFNRLRVQRSMEAYHLTGSFQNILLDASNKTLRAAYEETPYTWSLWARQAQSVSDFKNINRVQLGESPNLSMIPENTNYPEGKVTDSKVTYKVEKFGQKFSVSWETVINDDLDALGRIPAMHGAAARRTQDRVVYDALLANPIMPDGFALFSASHPSGTNITGTTPAAPGVTTLNEAFRFMSLQRGLNSSVILGLTPSILLVPMNYSAQALELVNSQSYAQANGNEGVVNIYGVNGVRPLTVVASPLLDASSTTNWYALASSTLVDTVEITFLSGEEAPVLENEWNKDNDTYHFYVRQSMAAAVIDHRGIFGNRT